MPFRCEIDLNLPPVSIPLRKFFGLSVVLALVSPGACSPSGLEPEMQESVGGTGSGTITGTSSGDQTTTGPSTGPSTGTSGTSGDNSNSTSTGEDPEGFGEPLTDDAQRNLEPDVDADELRQAGDATAELSWDLYQALRQGSEQNKNIALSGTSIQFAFALLHAAAKDETRLNVSEALRFVNSDETVHPVFNALSLELARRELPETPDASALRLRLAFGVWIEDSLEVNPTFPEFVGSHYGASLWKTPIKMDPKGAADRVNRWVSKQTEGLIPDLVDPPPSPLTTGMLVNAMYFYAPWEEPFKENFTEAGTFNGLDGVEIPVDYMNFDEARSLNLYEDASLQALTLPYRGGMLNLQIVLPRERQFEGVASSMTALRMQEIRQEMSYREVQLKLPKFGVETKYDLLSPLIDHFGLEQDIELWAFYADKILRVLHKVVLKIDEKGTEGAAATDVEVGEDGAGEEVGSEVIIVDVDRPFLFSVEDRTTGAVLFSGQVTVPE